MQARDVQKRKRKGRRGKQVGKSRRREKEKAMMKKKALYGEKQIKLDRK